MKAPSARHRLTPILNAIATAIVFAVLARPLPAQQAGTGGTLADWTAQPGVPAAQRGALDTPAGDGVTNLMKFALGVPVMGSATIHLPISEIITQADQTRSLALLFTRNPGAPGIRYTMEVSSELATWRDTVSLVDILEDSPDGTQRVRLREAVTPDTLSRFARLKVYVAPTGFAQIPAGTFTMGNSLSSTGDGDINELPLHSVTLPAFYLARTLTTWEDWQAVRDWAVDHGYPDLAGVGEGKAASHPVHSVAWYDVVKWCNAKSEMEGLTPCFYTDDAHTTIYRTGQVNVTNAQVDWAANGYRLPTESEWEYAARGGAEGRRFPWGDTIGQAQANYLGSPSRDAYDVSSTSGYHPSYFDSTAPYTSPVGSFAPNGFDLYDMVGNLSQRCWDLSGSYSEEALTAPHGPDAGTSRVIRGGSWSSRGRYSRLAYRSSGSSGFRVYLIGFRCARSTVP